jgi:FXSXX-COOH protein
MAGMTVTADLPVPPALAALDVPLAGLATADLSAVVDRVLPDAPAVPVAAFTSSI